MQKQKCLLRCASPPPRLNPLPMIVSRMPSLNTTGCNCSPKPYAIPVLFGKAELYAYGLKRLPKKNLRLKNRETEVQRNNCTKAQLSDSCLHSLFAMCMHEIPSLSRHDISPRVPTYIPSNDWQARALTILS